MVDNVSCQKHWPTTFKRKLTHPSKPVRYTVRATLSALRRWKTHPAVMRLPANDIVINNPMLTRNTTFAARLAKT